MPWIGHTVVLVLVAAAIAAPWLRLTAAARRRARRVVADIAGRQRSPRGHAGGPVALEGRLELRSDPVEAFDGGSAAASSAHFRGRRAPPPPVSVRAAGLELVCDDGERVGIDGPVEVRVGTRERAYRWRAISAPEAVRERLVDADETRGPEIERARASIRTAFSGDRVCAQGWLKRDPRGESTADYREAAGTWKLCGGAPESESASGAVVLAHRGAPRMRWSPRELVWRAAGMGLLLLVAVPWGLGHVGDRLERRARGALTECAKPGFDIAQRTDALRAVQEAFPGWTGSARGGRASLVGAVVSGVQRCARDSHPPHEFVEEAIELLVSRLSEIGPSDAFDNARRSVEQFLHERGRDRLIVELARSLPEGGGVAARVRAHLYLGDLEGAADVWREDGAEASARGPASKGYVLCMAGDYAAALEAFEERREALADGRSRLGRRATLVGQAECLRRAGELDRAERVADELSSLEYGDPFAAYLRALIAEDRGDLRAALAALEGFEHREPHALFALSLRARLGELEVIEGRGLDYTLSVYSVGSELYNNIFQPVLDLRRLTEVAETLAAMPDEAKDASGPARESARELAGRFHLAVALRRARRLDPRAGESFDRAEAHRPDDAHVRRVRRVMAFFHGDWDAPREGDDPRSHEPGVNFESLAAAYRGERPIEAGDRIGGRYALTSPSGLELEIELARMYSEGLTDRRMLSFLETQPRTATWPAIFYRLTTAVVHGRHLGFDMSERQAQLEALREMHRAQPNHVLLAGIDGRLEL